MSLLLLRSLTGGSAQGVHGSTVCWSIDIRLKQYQRLTTTGGITKMLRFTNVEYADMHFVYGSCDGNSLAALWEYQHWYVIRDDLTDVHLKWNRHSHDTCTCWPWKLQSVASGVCVFDPIYHNPLTSQHSSHFFCDRMSRRAAWWTVHENKLCPFHVPPVQDLQRGTSISLYTFLNDSYTRQCTPLNFCAMARQKGKILCQGSIFFVTGSI